MGQRSLVFISGKYEGGSYTLPEEGSITIGRGGELDIVVVEDMVSRRHAEVRVEGDQVIYEDLGSTNGSFLNGERFTKATLKNGDRLALGSSILEYRAPEQSDEAPKMTPPAEVSMPPQLDFDESPSELSMQAPEPFDAPKSFVDAPSDLSIMSLPDEDNLSSIDGDIEIAPTIEIPESGEIDDDTVRATIELLGTARFTGHLDLESDDEEHRIVFQNGRICAAEHADFEGLDTKKALFRLLFLDEGQFKTTRLDDVQGEPLSTETDKLLGESAYQKQEYDNLSAQLPDPEDKLLVIRPIPGRLRDLHEDELDIFQLIFNHGFFQLVLDKSTSSDLATARTVARLIDSGHIKV